MSTSSNDDIALRGKEIEAATVAPVLSEVVKAAEEEAKTTTQSDKNLMHELLRKVNKFSDIDRKISEALDQKLAALKTQLTPSLPVASVESDEDEPYVTKAEYKAEKIKAATETLQAKQRSSFGEVLETFGELDQKSEEFDKDFYDKTNDIYVSKFLNDPEGPMLAAKLAALELGKIDKIAKKDYLDDERRRTRILEQGGTRVRNNTSAPDTSGLKADRIKAYGGDPKKIEALMKANPERYGLPKKGK